MLIQLVLKIKYNGNIFMELPNFISTCFYVLRLLQDILLKEKSAFNGSNRGGRGLIIDDAFYRDF